MSKKKKPEEDVNCEELITAQVFLDQLQSELKALKLEDASRFQRCRAAIVSLVDRYPTVGRLVVMHLALEIEVANEKAAKGIVDKPAEIIPFVTKDKLKKD